MTKLIRSTLLLILFGWEPAVAKPPQTPRPSQAPTPAVSDAPPVTAPNASTPSWLHWLLEQNGTSSAIPLSWPDMIQAASGHQIQPFKAADPIDAALAAKIGPVMDGLLPRLNRPEGSARTAKHLALVPLIVEDEVLAAFAGMAGFSCEPTATREDARLGDPEAAAYPAFKLIDQASHRAYYLGVAFYPTGQRDSAATSLRLDPGVIATRVPANGTCLLLLLEHNNKSGGELAFLNWELVDLSLGKVRVQTSFAAVTGEVLPPAASIADGRRGRD